MEQSLSTLTYKGSITEAIAEAKQQKKLFLVYVSGDNQESNNLATLTWTDSTLAESILKFCILLHISEGSSDAANFSAIYPQKSPPCVTAIGYNGLLLWQYDGFIAADILVSSIERSWMSLHIQDVTATYLATALASNRQFTYESSGDILAAHGSSSESEILPSPNNLPEGEPSPDNETTALGSKQQPTSESSGDILAEPGSSLGSEILPSPRNLPEGEPSIDNETTALASKQKPTCESSGDILVEHGSFSGSEILPSTKNLPEGELSTDNEILEGNSCHQLASKVVDEIGSCLEADYVNSSGTASVSVNPCGKGFNISGDRSLTPEEIVNHSENMMEDSGKITGADVNADRNEDVSSNAPEPINNESNEVHFNIRLPDGSSLRVKFTVTDSLRMVKDYVDSNWTSNFGRYDLAIPYPRKVFQEEDFGKTLQELDLFRRQTLIVVQHGQSNTPAKKVLSLRGQQDHDGDRSSGGSNDGYWARIRVIVSFLNPLSYLRGSANYSDVVQEPQNNRMPYSSHDLVQNNARTAGTRQSARPPFGSNIHTLKHDEEDDSHRNTFWNGNSTQFGGDSDNNK